MAKKIRFFFCSGHVIKNKPNKNKNKNKKKKKKKKNNKKLKNEFFTSPEDITVSGITVFTIK